VTFAQDSVSEEKLNKASTTVEVVEPLSEPKTKAKPLAVIEQNIATKPPEVGKHVMANMDAGSMILSLLMVLTLIVICALVLKRFNLTQQSVSQLRVVTSLSLGAKERVLVVQVGEQQLLLGVTAQKITLLETLAEPIAEPTLNSTNLPKNLLSFLSSKKLQ